MKVTHLFEGGRSSKPRKPTSKAPSFSPREMSNQEDDLDTDGTWDLSELEGKKMPWEKAIKFVKTLPHVENNVPNESVFEVKKGVKFNMAKLIKLLNAMDPSIAAYKWPGSTRKFHVEFNWANPIKSKVVLPPTKDNDVFDAKVTELKKKMGGTHSGWYMGSALNGGFMTILGQFLEGPLKGKYFAVPYIPKEELKVGDEIFVKTHPERGQVKRVK